MLKLTDLRASNYTNIILGVVHYVGYIWHKVSETGSIYIIKCRGGRDHSLDEGDGPSFRKVVYVNYTQTMDNLQHNARIMNRSFLQISRESLDLKSHVVIIC
jgi:hypothetical protein